MGFKSYRFTEQSDDAWLLDDPQPLRFSGPNGLIAQWYRIHRLELDERPWLVTAHGWLALAFDIEAAESRWIVFEQTEGSTRKYARLERINGKFGAETRIMMQFKPLESSPGTIPLIVREPARSAGWSEEVSIDGGSGSDGCTWRWMTPKLSFASVVAG